VAPAAKATGASKKTGPKKTGSMSNFFGKTASASTVSEPEAKPASAVKKETATIKIEPVTVPDNTPPPAKAKSPAAEKKQAKSAAVTAKTAPKAKTPPKTKTPPKAKV